MSYDPFRGIFNEGDEPPPDPNAHAELLRLSEWGHRPITWLWDRMIPRRKVTLLVGEQEMGKSFFALDLAARLTRGESIPPVPASAAHFSPPVFLPAPVVSLVSLW